MDYDINRSLKDGRYYCHPEDENSVITLADRGYFQNNRQMIASSWWPSIRRLFQAIRSMTRLEKLSLLKCSLTLAEDLPLLFRSCPKLTELRLKLVESQKLEMGEELKNGLRSGFQRLRLFELHWGIHSWPVIQEMFT